MVGLVFAAMKRIISLGMASCHRCCARTFVLLQLTSQRCLKKRPRHWGRWCRGTSVMPHRIVILILAMAELTVLLGCGGLPRTYFHEDEYGRYYDTKSGQVLWVTPDGTVSDASFLRYTLSHRARPFYGKNAELAWIDGDSRVVLFEPIRLGRARWTDGDWDLSNYDTASETGMCRLPMTTALWPLDAPVNRYRYALESKRHSCLPLIWKAPVAVTESGILYGALFADAAIHFPLIQLSSVAQALLPD